MTNSMSTQFHKGPLVLVSRDIQYTFPLSYAYLAGYLREQGEDVRVLFKPLSPSHLRQCAQQILELNPVLVGFGSLYPELAEVRQIIQMLDEAGRRFPIVIGGQMVSPIPQFSVTITDADFGVIGEGEITLYQLVTALRQGRNPETIPGLVIRQGETGILTGPGEFIKNLRDLPPIPYDLFPSAKWLGLGQWYARHNPQPLWRFADRVINVHGGRGCPFTCNFCYHHSQVRYRPMNLMMAETAEALERFDGNMLYFSDETTLYSPTRVRDLLQELRRLNRPVEYSISSRFDILDRIDDDLLQEMQATGCRIMGLGIESGSDRILKIIGKNISVEMVRRGLERLRKVGILPTVSIMIGQYTETVEDAEASIALMRESVRSNPNIQYGFTLTTPFPGSQLYDLIFEQGLLRDDREFYDRYFQTGTEFQSVVNLSGMTEAELQAMYAKIQQVYQEEKLKAISWRARATEVVIGKFAGGHARIDHAIWAKLRNHPRFSQSRSLRMLDQFQQWLYEFIQIRLDHLKLRLRGISVKKR